MNKIYLGDGAYVEFDGHAFVLTTENGVNVQNTVVLEPEHVALLVRFPIEKVPILKEYVR